MLHSKTSVSINGLKPEMMFAVMAVMQASRQTDIDIYVTSACDGSHSDTSLHYIGHAMDFDAARDISQGEEALITRLIRQALPREFDLLAERDKEGKFSHWHIEFQPKRSLGLRISA